MANILTALIAIANSQKDIENITEGNNRMNAMGESLEEYIKGVFSDTLNMDNSEEKNLKLHRTFSYLGSKNSPPDMILRGGDAIEVKKIQTANANLQLNSSHPKAKLYSDNPKINHACKSCEDWREKDIIYCIGHIKERKLLSLWMVYGDCYAANKETYIKAEIKIKEAIGKIDDLDIVTKTNELAGVKHVDPLGITYLRIRGMWIIQNPSKLYSCLDKIKKEGAFTLFALMRREKYLSFPEDDRRAIESSERFFVDDVKIQDPDNPANLLDAISIVHKVET